MEFIYKYARLPEDNRIKKEVNQAAVRLFNKLKCLDINSLSISGYQKKYLNNYFRNLHNILQIYSYILCWSIAHRNGPFNEFVFLDYGGGSGMLSFLAKELNLGTVIYNDISEPSCEDAKKIGESIGIHADCYLIGDIEEVIEFLKSQYIFCNAIASFDVIEHIYNIESFLSKLHLLSKGPLNVVMSTGANPFNPKIRRTFTKSQIENEYRDHSNVADHYERDCMRAYLKVRKEIILKYSKSLDEEEIKELSKATRGMREDDIKKCLDKYLQTREMPKKLAHPTNTCDPYSGNWCEHLMDPYQLKSILEKNGFKTKILSGYWGTLSDYWGNPNVIKREFYSFMNLCINIFGKQGIRIAPFYTIYARRDAIS